MRTVEFKLKSEDTYTSFTSDAMEDNRVAADIAENFDYEPGDIIEIKGVGFFGVHEVLIRTVQCYSIDA